VIGEDKVAISSVQPLLDRLVSARWFDMAPSSDETLRLARAINDFTSSDMQISKADLYASLNRAVSSNNVEGRILLRVSMFFTGIFAIFMGFLAVFLQTLDFSLGWVYMSMGVIIGSAVGPASLTILMEKANGMAIAAGAVGGLVLGVLGWALKAQSDSGEVSYSTLGSDWPWVVGNLCAIIGGGLIALVGSLAMPDNEFRWSMLNERIPLVDDIEPPKADDETDERLQKHVKIAITASVVLTFVLLVLWPLPMHGGAGVFSEGGFATWVVLEILWAIVGGAVIIILPAAEIIMTFSKAKKAYEASKSAGEGTATLKDGQPLSINFKEDSGAKLEKVADC
jgi:uncharacterized integral membrane protein